MIDRPMIGGYSLPPGKITDKWCSGCKKHHPRSEFAQMLSTCDGLQYWCKAYSTAYRHAKKRAKEPK